MRRLAQFLSQTHETSSRMIFPVSTTVVFGKRWGPAYWEDLGLRVFLGLFVTAFVLAQPASATTFGVNLIDNPSFEVGDKGCGPISGWTVEIGAPCVLDSEDEDIEPADGLRFFFGGSATLERMNSMISQLVDVSDVSSAIDASSVAFELSGYFAGIGAGPLADRAKLEIEFLDSSTGSLGTTMIGDFGTDAVFVLDSDSGVVPAGTRSIRIELEASILTTGEDIDGYADALSLILVPEPSGALLVACGVVGLGFKRRRAP